MQIYEVDGRYGDTAAINHRIDQEGVVGGVLRRGVLCRRGCPGVGRAG